MWILGDLETGVLYTRLPFLPFSLEISLEKEALRNLGMNLPDLAALCGPDTERRLKGCLWSSDKCSVASSTEDTEEVSSGEARPGLSSSQGTCWRWFLGTE